MTTKPTSKTQTSKTTKKSKKENKPVQIWRSVSGFETVRECVDQRGMADAYAFDGMYVSPCGKIQEDVILCSCAVCEG